MTKRKTLFSEVQPKMRSVLSSISSFMFRQSKIYSTENNDLDLIPRAGAILGNYFIDIPPHQHILDAYCKSLNIRQIQITTLYANSLEEFNALFIDKGVPQNKEQSFLLFKLSDDQYVFSYHAIFSTNSKHSRVRNLITFYNLLEKAEFFCAGHILFTVDRGLFLSQKSDVVVSDDQLNQCEWTMLAKLWDAFIISAFSKPRAKIFERWILDQLFKDKTKP